MAKQQPPRPTRTDWQNFVPPQEEGLLQKYGAQYGYSQQQTPQEEAGFVDKLWGSAKAVGEGLTFLPGGVVDTVQDVVFGFDPADKAEMAQRAQREQELQAYQQRYAGQAFEAVTDAMASMPYSAVTMGAGLAGGVAGGFAGPVGAGAAGMAASGTAAYRASKPQFQRTLYQATTEALGREPSPEEWGRVESNFEDAATSYGLWEAGPEAISNLLMVKILGPLGSKFKGGVKDVIKSVAGLYGEELATETITQMGQGAIEAEIGLRENAPGVVEAFNEVAPAAFWQTTLMAGGKKGLDLAFRRARGNGQAVESEGPLVSEEGTESVPQTEAGGVGGMLSLPPAKQTAGYPKPKWGYVLPSFVTAQYGGRHDAETKGDTATPATEVQAKTPAPVDLSEHFARKLQEGTKYVNIGQARRESMELTGKRLVPGTNDVKALDESIELGVVKAARGLIAEMRGNGASDVDIYRRLVELYQQHPNLSVRTSTSVAQQAYSTPAPLAFLASHLAGITNATTVYEPTAGNGMLIMEANPEKAVVNELNADRADRLRSLGFTVTEKDAATLDPGKAVDMVRQLYRAGMCSPDLDASLLVKGDFQQIDILLTCDDNFREHLMSRMGVHDVEYPSKTVKDEETLEYLLNLTLGEWAEMMHIPYLNENW